jgi:hypothetical protein
MSALGETHKEEAAVTGGFSPDPATWMLFKLGRDATEFRVEAATNRVDGGDDNDRNAGSDQTVFDCGRTRLVFEKRKNSRHDALPVLFSLPQRSLASLRDSCAGVGLAAIRCQDFPDTRSTNATDYSNWSKDIYGPDFKINAADMPTFEKA